VSAVLATGGLEVAYGNRVVLSGVSLRLGEGERFCLLGPNAAGKTTLLRAVLGLVPSRGGIRLEAWPVGALLEHPGVPRQAGTLDYLEFHARLQGVRSARSRAGELLKSWDLPDAAWSTLSLGQRQRLQIARSLVHFPRLLLLDEPSANLDPASRNDLWERLEAWRRGGNSLLWTSHDLPEAMDRADRIGVLSEGRLRWVGGAEAFVREFPTDLACRCEGPGAYEACARALSGVGTVEAGDGAGTLRLTSPLPPSRLLRRLVESGVPVSSFGPDGQSLFGSYRKALAHPPAPSDAEPLPASLRSSGPSLPPWRPLGVVARWELSQVLREPRLFVPFLFLSVLFLALQAVTHARIAPALFLLPASICASLAADLVAGERERQGLDVLLAAASPVSSILAGKALAAWLGGLAPGLVLLSVSANLSSSPLPESLLLLGSGTFCATLLSVRWAAGAQTVRAAAQVAVLAALGISLLYAILPLSGSLFPGAGRALAAGLLVLLPLLSLAGLPGAVRRYRRR
jgi:ABC-2 type transport system ATP-binding protein